MYATCLIFQRTHLVHCRRGHADSPALAFIKHYSTKKKFLRRAEPSTPSQCAEMRLELATLLALVIPASTLFAPAARPVLPVPSVPVTSSGRATVARECTPSGIRHVLRSRDAAMCAAAEAEKDDQPGLVARSKAWVKKWVHHTAPPPPPPSSSSQVCLTQAKFDKEKLKTLGVDAFFTYGVVSNINAGFTVALAWGTFSKASGLSPLAPGQWKAFLVT